MFHASCHLLADNLHEISKLFSEKKKINKKKKKKKNIVNW